MEQKKKQTLGYILGIGALKAALTDIPKATLEKTIEEAGIRKFRKQSMRPAFKPAAIAKAFKQRGLSRAAGGIAIGALTFPLFLSGIKDIKEGDTRRRNRGMLKILASGLLYSGGKGGTEYALEALQSGKGVSSAKLTKIFRKAFTARAIPGLVASGVTAAAIGYGLKKKKETQKPTGIRRFTVPLIAAGVGGLTAAAKQIPESVYYHAKGAPFSAKAYRAVLRRPELWVPRTIGRGVAGAFSAGLLGAIVEKALKTSEKK